jgi:hypothetical protein
MPDVSTTTGRALSWRDGQDLLGQGLEQDTKVDIERCVAALD